MSNGKDRFWSCSLARIAEPLKQTCASACHRRQKPPPIKEPPQINERCRTSRANDTSRWPGRHESAPCCFAMLTSSADASFDDNNFWTPGRSRKLGNNLVAARDQPARIEPSVGLAVVRQPVDVPMPDERRIGGIDGRAAADENDSARKARQHILWRIGTVNFDDVAVLKGKVWQ